MLKISLLFKKNLETLRVNNSRIIMIKNATFSGYYLSMNLNIWGDFKSALVASQNSSKKTCRSLFLIKLQVKVLKNTSFREYLQVTAFVIRCFSAVNASFQCKSP